MFWGDSDGNYFTRQNAIRADVENGNAIASNTTVEVYGNVIVNQGRGLWIKSDQLRNAENFNVNVTPPGSIKFFNNTFIDCVKNCEFNDPEMCDTHYSPDNCRSCPNCPLYSCHHGKDKFYDYWCHASTSKDRKKWATKIYNKIKEWKI